MTGIIKLTGVHGKPIYISALHATFFTPSTPSLCQALCGDSRMHEKDATIVMVGGMPIQVTETQEQLLTILSEFNKQEEDRTIKLHKKLSKEDWEDKGGWDYQDDEENED